LGDRPGCFDDCEDTIPKTIALLLLIAPLLASPPAEARSVAGTEMPDSVRVQDALLTLNGVAVFKKFGMQFLVSGLWLDHLECDPAKILESDLPRRSVTHFLRNVSAKRICKTWSKGLRENSPEASLDVREQFETLYGWTRDFLPGDEITVTYMPGQGSTVDIGGVFMGSLPGKPFADAFFACALGPKPAPGDKFKKRLLGR
jgi:hypothetical protein